MVNFCHLACSRETKRLIVEDCVQEFLRYNPDFVGMKVTHELILRRLALYYLEQLRKPGV
jgi:hypothetical protein